MNQYFTYFLTITTFVFAYMWYEEKKKHFTTQVELDLIKARGRIGSINVNLEDNRAAYKAARDKFHEQLHRDTPNPVPDYMLEHVNGTSPVTDGPSTDTRGTFNGASLGPKGAGSEQ